MDRNGLGGCHYRDDVSSLSARRAWIEISITATRMPIGCVSLSARRAWIEISLVNTSSTVDSVALRKESVDRNFCARLQLLSMMVALRKESVDRNIDAVQIVIVVMRRSPQGERG